jgi:hypothetical protein
MQTVLPALSSATFYAREPTTREYLRATPQALVHQQ